MICFDFKLAHKYIGTVQIGKIFSASKVVRHSASFAAGRLNSTKTGRNTCWLR